MTAPSPRPSGRPDRTGSHRARPYAILGGAGFIGTNLIGRLLDRGDRVIVFDNLSRPGSERNLDWLRDTYGDRCQVDINDIRDRSALAGCLDGAGAVVHLAAQVAVTTSLVDPEHDFDVNLRGTLGVLEELRRLGRPVPLIYTSTNKVYGGLEALALTDVGERYALSDPAVNARGIDESHTLELCSPYGCSKGAAEQYVLEYSRSFGVPAAVARMSCIYGPHQNGNEDQGWVAHFVRSAVLGRPITIYGDGKQVRDILHVNDLVTALLLLLDGIDRTRGQAFNLGGGPGNTVSLRELVAMLTDLTGRPVPVQYDEPRVSDQRYFVTDTGKIERWVGWRPTVSATGGVELLYRWMLDQVQHETSQLPTDPPSRRAPSLGGELG